MRIQPGQVSRDTRFLRTRQGCNRPRELHAFANGGGNVAADHHFRYRQPSAGLKDAKGFAEDAILVAGEIDDAVRNDGSAQELVETRILGGFLKNDEFGLGEGHALGLEQ
jgi:hypothetical protein